MILLPVAVQFSQPHLLKRLYFPQVIFLPTCSRLIDHVSMDINLGSLFYSIDLFLCQCHTYYLKSRSVITQSLFFLKIVWLFGVFCVSIKNLDLCSSSVKNAIGILMGIVLNLRTALDIMVILMTLIFLIRE